MLGTSTDMRVFCLLQIPCSLILNLTVPLADAPWCKCLAVAQAALIPFLYCFSFKGLRYFHFFNFWLIYSPDYSAQSNVFSGRQRLKAVHCHRRSVGHTRRAYSSVNVGGSDAKILCGTVFCLICRRLCILHYNESDFVTFFSHRRKPKTIRIELDN